MPTNLALYVNTRCQRYSVAAADTHCCSRESLWRRCRDAFRSFTRDCMAIFDGDLIVLMPIYFWHLQAPNSSVRRGAHFVCATCFPPKCADTIEESTYFTRHLDALIASLKDEDIDICIQGTAATANIVSIWCNLISSSTLSIITATLLDLMKEEDDAIRVSIVKVCSAFNWLVELIIFSLAATLPIVTMQREETLYSSNAYAQWPSTTYLKTCVWVHASYSTCTENVRHSRWV